ncbi:YgjV family protein [Thalassotalea litorea]|uniref:YgjV family protein n=1 Tax=Thalassotalea litorea TaxID=2020715 RepID=UPI0037356B21
MSITEIGQLVGGISFLLAVLAFYQKDDRYLKTLLMAVYLIHGVHFYLLDSLVPATLCLISFLRTLISLYIRSSRMAIIFIVLIALLSYLNYQSLIDLLPIAASVLGTYALLCLSGIKMRLAILIGSALWLINNIFIGSIGGTLMEIFIISTNAFTIYRLMATAEPRG